MRDSLGETALKKYNKLLDAEALEAMTKAPYIVGVTWETEYSRNSSMGYGPMITIHWHQGESYNNYLPLLKNGKHAHVGCPAVFEAQIIAHYNHPQYYDNVPLYTSQLRAIKTYSKNFNSEDQLHKIAYFHKVVFDNVITSYDETAPEQNMKVQEIFCDLSAILLPTQRATTTLKISKNR